MIKKVLLALALSLFASNAFAVCAKIPLNVLDSIGGTAALSSATAADGNCKTYIDADTSSQIHADLIAPVVAGTARIGYVSDDPCTQLIKINVPISMTGTTTVKLVSLTAAQKIYICALNLRASAATVWSIADGTKVTTECDTAPEAVIGATTATHGAPEAANGGNAYGAGTGTIALTNTAAHDLCLFQSGAGDLSGNLTYVKAP